METGGSILAMRHGWPMHDSKLTRAAEQGRGLVFFVFHIDGEIEGVQFETGMSPPYSTRRGS